MVSAELWPAEPFERSCQWCGAGVRELGLRSGPELRDLLSHPVCLGQVWV